MIVWMRARKTMVWHQMDGNISRGVFILPITRINCNLMNVRAGSFPGRFAAAHKMGTIKWFGGQLSWVYAEEETSKMHPEALVRWQPK